MERKSAENGVNAYLMTMISRNPRQIVAFDVDRAKAQQLIQNMVDGAPPAERHFTDGYYGYCEIIFPGKHMRNERDKSDTHLVESINADLRHYIPGLRRKSGIFYRTIETFKAVVSVFVDAYNKYGERKMLFRTNNPDFKSDLPFGVLDLLVKFNANVHFLFYQFTFAEFCVMIFMRRRRFKAVSII